MPENLRRCRNVPLEARKPVRAARQSRKGVPESDVRTALATGDMGFLHSFTTGATVDGPGVRVVAWTAGCMWRCRYCHNPDTWTMSNGIPVTVTKAVEELRKYRHGLKVMSGGLTVSGGEPLMQHRFVEKLFAAASGMGIHTALDTNGYYRRQIERCRARQRQPRAARSQDLGSRTPSEPHRHGQRADARVRAPAGGPTKADLAALRARSGIDRRPGRHREDRDVRR